ncbi:MAG: hemerythrin domain-containing protein [Tepidiformaceae bacterium]
MADRVVGPLREARAPLTDGLRQLQLAAVAVESAEAPVALAALETAIAYLRNTFLPVAEAEEFTLYIAVDGVLGAVGAADVMKAQHASIAVMTEDLGKVVAATRADDDVQAYARYLLPLLHGLYALIRAHLEAEDDVYLALLDLHVSESQVTMIVDNIERISAARREDALAGRQAKGDVSP